MKTLIRLPVSIVKVILSIVALPIGILIMIAGIIAYTRPKTLPTKEKEHTVET